MTTPTAPDAPRRTLGLTGVTINAMTLTAPGAFAWLLYQLQAAGQVQGLGGIWPGVLAALAAALLTALSFGQLARRYPQAGFRSAYHFAEQVFREHSHPRLAGLARLAKFATGWAAHLYYWVYPGALVAFTGTLADYLLRRMGYQPTVFGQLILAGSFAAFIGFLALRGITGTTSSSIILNTIQLIALAALSVLAVLFRVLNPAGLTAWTAPTVAAILLPPSFQGLAFQAGLAMTLVVGFEAVTSLGASAANAQRDLPRAAILALILQGIFAYLLVYFAAGLAFNPAIDLAGSHAPLGDLAIQLGDSLLKGHGFTLMFVTAFAVIVALLAAMLTAVNNGVRVSFSMSLDADLPDVLGLLHPRYATPYFTVLLLSTVSALIGAAGILGGLPALLGIVLAANLGALLMYAILCALTIAAFAAGGGFNWFRHALLPGLGLVLTLGLAATAVWAGLSAGGTVATGCFVALGLAGGWLLLSLSYYVLRR